ncbi:polysaccharide pyruvyl transferase family protein [Hydrogenophaga sp. D2P1]|uniref:Polysaccharide pyruvyl transferase family protein n=1 Tax=Hydrogenophaga aromaticivorans TaxID=2610898 RepID=A0A7Y8GSW5_9BURK|nr:polysaccharide pyruvyl transferase family protein [Hydrogenophaga aromaticivorans]NWF44269.1 polysaccharide pyruvyl transferase family protein [Hydrogenophaga aromaticivorans]
MKKSTKTIIFSYLQLSNVGCEIIIRGTIKFLENALSDYDLRFIVPSYDSNRDRQILKDLPQIEVVPMLSWKRYFRALLRQTRRFDKYWSPRFSSAAFEKADLFVSVGGDIYTIFDGMLPDDWMGYESFASRRGIPSIMFGANMENFELLSGVQRNRLIAHLNRFKLIAVRDDSTSSYLIDQNINSPTLVFPDPMYSLRPSCVVRANKVQRIGLNLSPLTVKKFGPDLIEKYTKIVSDLINDGYLFSFIPHVYSTDGDNNLDDRFILRNIYNRLEPIQQKAVKLCDDALGFKKIAIEISEVDFVIAARMHCCLNAVTLGKPVYFLEYSKKAKTMLKWLVTETPYAKAASAYASTSADAITIEDIRLLIRAIEHLGEAHPDGISVDLSPQLATSSIWNVMSGILL